MQLEAVTTTAELGQLPPLICTLPLPSPPDTGGDNEGPMLLPPLPPLPPLTPLTPLLGWSPWSRSIPGFGRTCMWSCQCIKPLRQRHAPVVPSRIKRLAPLSASSSIQLPCTQPLTVTRKQSDMNALVF